jgi:hypothetical protein
MSIATIDVQPCVNHVTIRNEMLTVQLTDGRLVLVPLDWYPRLHHTSEAERQAWRVFEDSDERDVIFWESLDEFIPVVALLTGTPSRESQSSFQRWLAGRDRPVKDEP